MNRQDVENRMARVAKTLPNQENYVTDCDCKIVKKLVYLGYASIQQDFKTKPESAYVCCSGEDECGARGSRKCQMLEGDRLDTK